MADELNPTATDGAGGDAESGSSSTNLDINALPDQGTQEDLRPFKAAYERTKALNQQLAQKVQLLDELIAQGINPSEIPKIVKEKEEAQNQVERIRAEAIAEKDAEVKKHVDQYQQRLTGLDQHIKSQSVNTMLNELFVQSGGTATDGLALMQFRSLVQPFLEVEYEPLKNDEMVIGYNASIKEIKTADGKPYFVDHEKEAGKVRPANAEDFMIAAKKGKYGSALQAMLPAFNQSTGAGLPLSGGGRSQSGKIQLSSDSKVQAEQIKALSPADQQKVAKGDFVVI